jgi:hypothetical protein
MYNAPHRESKLPVHSNFILRLKLEATFDRSVPFAHRVSPLTSDLNTFHSE